MSSSDWTARQSIRRQFPIGSIDLSPPRDSRIRLHDLRHTSATLLLDEGIPLKVVSERLGHSSVSITADLYQHVLEHMQSEATAAVGKVLLA